MRTGTALVILAALLTAFNAAGGRAAGNFEVLHQPSGGIQGIALYQESASAYLDLNELAVAIRARPRWENLGERIVLAVDGVEFVFEDLLAFFSAGGAAFQLVAPCLVVRGTFLVPAQFATEYLPRLLPGRFAYDKTAGRLVDRTGPGAQPGPVARSVPATPAPSAPLRSDRRPRDEVGSYRISTVVIDPGHGGRDPGAIGSRYRLREKETVLDISQRVVAHLRQSGLGLRVLITRNDDTFVPLQRRGQMANMESAGLFVSIHCNAHRNSTIRGTSTYFLDAAKTDEERATAMLENAALKHEIEEQDQEGMDEINLILQDMAQNEFLRESKDLSAFIHREIVRVLGLQDRGIKQANFAVLRGAYMPAALVETAYISNPDDEALLRDAKFRENVARAVSDGIIKYIEHYHRKLASGN